MPTHHLQNLWQQRILPYYQSLDAREQRLVGFAAVSVPLMILIFGMILPLHDAVQAKRQALADLQTQAQEAEMLAERALQRGQQATTTGNILTKVDQVARAQKVRSFITSLRPQPGGEHPRLWVQMQQAPYADTVHFYQALAQQGIHIVQIKWRKTAKPGFVHVQAVVQ